jgi:hypothetical protein
MLPDGTASRPLRTDEFVTDPVQESPTFALFEVRLVLSVTSIDVPEGMVRLAMREVVVTLPVVWTACPSSRHPDRATAATSAILEIQCA